MRGALRFACVAAPIVLAGCELKEITIVDVEDVVIAEIYVNLAGDPTENEIIAFLHRTVGTARTGLVPDARITVRRADGLTLNLVTNQLGDCIGSFPLGGSGACFLADPAQTQSLRPGDFLEVEVTLMDGGTLFGAVRVPSPFQILAVSPTCRLDPNTLMPVRWVRSEGAWAYVNETLIRGLPEALEPEGIVVEADPLYLLGLSISVKDTTIVFPSEFGVFNRFELDQDVAVRLQSGLPPSTTAEVAITAVERNYVNWARGGNFNPSGRVRVPSLRGDGTGVFAATVNRRFVVFSSEPGGSLPDCPVS